MSKKLVIGGIFLSSIYCFAMDSKVNDSGMDSNDFVGTVCSNPTGNLENSINSLEGNAKKLGDIFLELYVSTENGPKNEKDRQDILNSLNSNESAMLYTAADFVARSYFAEMQRSSLFDVEKAEKAKQWLSEVTNDAKYVYERPGVYKDGERISDLLEAAESECKKRNDFATKSDKYEEDLNNLLKIMGEEEEESKE